MEKPLPLQTFAKKKTNWNISGSTYIWQKKIITIDIALQEFSYCKPPNKKREVIAIKVSF